MNIVLLSGGSGKRLWPLSNEARSEQFLKLLKSESNQYESMVQRVYRKIHEAGIKANIVVEAGRLQSDSILSQFGNIVDMVLEPEQRDTFPSVALSSAYLSLEKKVQPDEVVLVLPVDRCADLDYFAALLTMEQAVRDGAGDIVLMGIKPKSPSTLYEYIVPADGETSGKAGYIKVHYLTEKPSEKTVQDLIEKGAYWNSGVFAFKLGYLMDIVKQSIPAGSFEDVRAQFAKFNKSRFENEVVMKASTAAMVPYDGEWKDLSDWGSLSLEMQDSCIGHSALAEDRGNTHIVNELDIPILALGTKDLVITASPDGILVSDMEHSAELSHYVDQFKGRPMYEERRWGEYRVLNYLVNKDGGKSLTKHLKLNPGAYISYQSHNHRDEVWTFVDGTGDLLMDGHIRNVKRGDIAYITKGQKHAIRAVTELSFIEVQIGTDLVEQDIDRYPWTWD